MSDRHLIARGALRGARAGHAELREYQQASGRPMYLLTSSWSDERGNGHHESTGFGDGSEAFAALSELTGRAFTRAELDAQSLHGSLAAHNALAIGSATPGGPPHVEQIFAGPATCTRCGGHGVELGYSGPALSCPACDGSGLEPIAD